MFVHQWLEFVVGTRMDGVHYYHATRRHLLGPLAVFWRKWWSYWHWLARRICGKSAYRLKKAHYWILPFLILSSRLSQLFRNRSTFLFGYWRRIDIHSTQRFRHPTAHAPQPTNEQHIIFLFESFGGRHVSKFWSVMILQISTKLILFILFISIPTAGSMGQQSKTDVSYQQTVSALPLFHK